VWIFRYRRRSGAPRRAAVDHQQRGFPNPHPHHQHDQPSKRDEVARRQRNRLQRSGIQQHDRTVAPSAAPSQKLPLIKRSSPAVARRHQFLDRRVDPRCTRHRCRRRSGNETARSRVHFQENALAAVAVSRAQRDEETISSADRSVSQPNPARQHGAGEIALLQSQRRNC